MFKENPVNTELAPSCVSSNVDARVSPHVALVLVAAPVTDCTAQYFVPVVTQDVATEMIL